MVVWPPDFNRRRPRFQFGKSGKKESFGLGRGGKRKGEFPIGNWWNVSLMMISPFSGDLNMDDWTFGRRNRKTRIEGETFRIMPLLFLDFSKFSLILSTLNTGLTRRRIHGILLSRQSDEKRLFYELFFSLPKGLFFSGNDSWQPNGPFAWQSEGSRRFFPLHIVYF